MAQEKMKDIFTHQMGQYLFPGQPTIIQEKKISPVTDITMKSTKPQIALTPYGAAQMAPNMNYSFAGNTVVELPMAQMGRQAGNNQQAQLMQLIQMYAQMKGIDPNQLIQEIQSLPQEEQQKSLQLIMGEVQQAMAQQQQQQQQAAMAQQGQGAAPQEEVPMAKDGGCMDCEEAFPQANMYPTSWAGYSGTQYAQGGEAYPQAMNMNWFYENALKRYMAAGGPMLPQAQTNTAERFDRNEYNKNNEAQYNAAREQFRQNSAQRYTGTPVRVNPATGVPMVDLAGVTIRPDGTVDYDQAMKNMGMVEDNVNDYLGNPQIEAIRYANSFPPNQVDRVRHATAAALTNQAIQDQFPGLLKYTGIPQTAGFLGSNFGGFWHELTNWNDESIQDLYNNFIGSAAGTFNNEDYAKRLIREMAQKGTLLPGEKPKPELRRTVLLPGNRKQGGEAFPQAQTYLPYDRPGETRPNFMFQMGGQDEFGGQPDLETIYRKMKSGGLAVDAKKKRSGSLSSDEFTQYLSKGGLKHYQGDEISNVERPKGTFLNDNGSGFSMSPGLWLDYLKQGKVYGEPAQPDMTIPSDLGQQADLAESYYKKMNTDAGQHQNNNLVAMAEYEREEERKATGQQPVTDRLPGESDDAYFMRINNQTSSTTPASTATNTTTGTTTAAAAIPATPSVGSGPSSTSTTTGTTPIVQNSPYATNVSSSINKGTQNTTVDAGGGRSTVNPNGSITSTGNKNQGSGYNPSMGHPHPLAYYNALMTGTSKPDNIFNMLGPAATIVGGFANKLKRGPKGPNTTTAFGNYLANKENKWDYQPPTYPALERNQESEGVGAASGAKKGGKIRKLYKYQGIAGADMASNSSTVGDMSGGMSIANTDQYGSYGFNQQSEPMITANQAMGQQQTTNIQDSNLQTPSEAYQRTAEMGQPKMQKREAREMERMSRLQAKQDWKNFKQTDEFKDARKQDRKDFWKDPNAKFDHAFAAQTVGATNKLAGAFKYANDVRDRANMEKLGVNSSATLGVKQGSNRGDVEANTGQFRPNDRQEAQDFARSMSDKDAFYDEFNQMSSARMGGRILDFFEDGGVYDLDEDTIRLIMEAGGSVEFI